jgi:hypothetical protein
MPGTADAFSGDFDSSLVDMRLGLPCRPRSGNAFSGREDLSGVVVCLVLGLVRRSEGEEEDILSVDFRSVVVCLLGLFLGLLEGGDDAFFKDFIDLDAAAGHLGLSCRPGT